MYRKETMVGAFGDLQLVVLKFYIECWSITCIRNCALIGFKVIQIMLKIFSSDVVAANKRRKHRLRRK